MVVRGEAFGVERLGGKVVEMARGRRRAGVIVKELMGVPKRLFQYNRTFRGCVAVYDTRKPHYRHKCMVKDNRNYSLLIESKQHKDTSRGSSHHFNRPAI